MSRGFIPLIAIAIVGLVGVLTAGGAYTVYKINHLEKENQRISNELAFQQQAQEDNTQIAVNDIATSSLALATTTPESVKEKKDILIPKQSVSGVSSKDMIDTINVWIEQSESFSDSINEHIATIDYYAGTASRSDEALSKLIDEEDDTYLLSMWQYLSNITGALLEISASAKSKREFSNNVPDLISSANGYIAGLEKKKSEIPEYYANEEIYKAEYLKLVDYKFASYDKVLTQIHDAQVDYLETVQIAMSKISDTEPDINDYMSQQRISNTNVINNVIYQAQTVPQLQMPKTTYCNMNGTCARNYYSITCNTY